MNGCIVLTNDDGIEAPAIHSLAGLLVKDGHRVVIVAPLENKSACGMSLTLRQKMGIKRYVDRECEGLRVYSIDGTPCDCVIAVGDGLLQRMGMDLVPRLVVSGVNIGSNMSVDSWHSGTMAAAREAGLYGMPGLAASLSTFESETMEQAVTATHQVIRKLLNLLPEMPVNWPRDIHSDTSTNILECLVRGDAFLNLNIPPDWNGIFRHTRLGRRYYLGALSIEGDSIQIGAADIIDEATEAGDVDADSQGYASLSLLATHPHQHPSMPDESVFRQHLEEDWLQLQSRR